MNTSEVLNLESLKNILDKYFPERQDTGDDDLKILLEELFFLNINEKLLKSKISILIDWLPEIEQGEFDKCGGGGNWSKSGAVRTVLYFTTKTKNAHIPWFSECVNEYLTDWENKNSHHFTMRS
jgi:hypothetical protein